MTVKPYDPTVKALVEAEPASWPAFLGHSTGPTEVIDADIATISGAADKVLRVRAGSPYLVHLEFVTGHDAATLPRKLLARNALLHDRHVLPVCSAVVLLRPEADSPQVVGRYQVSLVDEEAYLHFRYQVVRVWQLPPEPLLRGSLSLLPLAPISAVTEEQLPDIIQRMQERLSSRRARRQAQLVWGAAYILLGLRYSPERLAELFRGVVSMEESSTYQAILAEGWAKGMAKGMAEGRAEGRAQGRAEGRAEGRSEGAATEARKLLRVFGDHRFGPPDPTAAAILDAITDLAQLETLCQRLETAASWQELLAPPTPAPRRRRRPRS